MRHLSLRDSEKTYTLLNRKTLRLYKTTFETFFETAI